MKKTLIFSDTHLSAKPNPKKLNFMQELFQEFDHIIINGDFWDYSKTSFDEFLTSEWAQLFPILKEKNAVYVFGNHDPKHHMDDRIYLFCDTACYVHNVELPNGKTLRVEHGQDISFISRLSYKIFKNHPKLMVALCSPLGFTQVFMKYLSKKGHYTLSRLYNRSYLKFSKNFDGFLVTGHSHGILHDENLGYFNSGFIDKNFASYVEVDGINIRVKKVKY